jgi:hypothetical protein
MFITTEGDNISGLPVGAYPLDMLKQDRFGTLSGPVKKVNIYPGDIQMLMDNKTTPIELLRIFNKILKNGPPGASVNPKVNIDIHIDDWYKNGTGTDASVSSRDDKLKWLLCLREMQKFDQIKDFIKTASAIATSEERNNQIKVIFKENYDRAIPYIVNLYFPGASPDKSIEIFKRLFEDGEYGTPLSDLITTPKLWNTKQLWDTFEPNRVIKYLGTLMGATEIKLINIKYITSQPLFTACVLDSINKGTIIDPKLSPLITKRDVLDLFEKSAETVPEHRTYVDAISGTSSLGELPTYYQELINHRKLSTIRSGIDVLDGASTKNLISSAIEKGSGGIDSSYEGKDIHVIIKDPNGRPMIEFTIQYGPSGEGNYDLFVKKYFELDCSEFISVREGGIVSRQTAWNTIRSTGVLNRQPGQKDYPSSRKMQKDICFKSHKSLMDLSKIILAEYDIKKRSRVGTTFNANDTCAAYSSAFITGVQGNGSTPCLLTGTGSASHLVKPIKIVMKKRFADSLDISRLHNSDEDATDDYQDGADPMEEAAFGKKRNKKVAISVYKDINYLKSL